MVPQALNDGTVGRGRMLRTVAAGVPPMLIWTL
jgi:hypothetical protein